MSDPVSPDAGLPAPNSTGDPALKQYLIDEFVEDYTDGRLTRRQLLQRLIGITGSLVAANVILAACAAPPAATTAAPPVATTAAPPIATTAPVPTASARATSETTGVTVDPNDPAIEVSSAQFASGGTNVMAYQARPRGNGQYPVILVCHENRGLTEYIRDVARRLAKANYVGFAVDLLSRQGGTDKVGADQAPGVLANLPPEQMVGDFQAALKYLQGQSYVASDRAGMVGFCFGGGITWRCAEQMPELRAAVPFYGPNPPLQDVPKIRAAVLAIYGGLDTRITGSSGAIEDAMKQNGKTFEKIVYPNADHAFHNDTGTRYNPEAAREAWAKTIAWFDQYVRG